MPTHKKFIMYAIWVILFFIFSQVMIYFAINTTYKDKNIEVKTTFLSEAKAQATSVNGFVNLKLKKNVENEIKEKYIVIDCLKQQTSFHFLQ